MQGEDQQLDELPLESFSKVEAWLVYREAKPAATISFTYEGDTPVPNENVEMVENWMKAHNIYAKQDPKVPTLLHISKNELSVNKLCQIALKFDPQSTYEKGVLFGYPLEAVEIFSKHCEELMDDITAYKKYNLVYGGSPEARNFPHYWTRYNRYITRENEIYEDSLLAKKWADIAREEIPLVAQKFEESLKNAVYR